jgi:putative transcriptional regulator
MTPEEVKAAAGCDPNARPFTPEQLAKVKRIPCTKTLRQALQLTQEEFAAPYRIPLGTLRDWEQGRSEPDQPARAYLTVIARERAMPVLHSVDLRYVHRGKAISCKLSPVILKNKFTMTTTVLSSSCRLLELVFLHTALPFRKGRKEFGFGEPAWIEVDPIDIPVVSFLQQTFSPQACFDDGEQGLP